MELVNEEILQHIDFIKRLLITIFALKKSLKSTKVYVRFQANFDFNQYG